MLKDNCFSALISVSRTLLSFSRPKEIGNTIKKKKLQDALNYGHLNSAFELLSGNEAPARSVNKKFLYISKQ